MATKRTQLHVVLDVDHEGMTPVQLRDAAREALPGVELASTPSQHAVVTAVWVDG